MLLERRFHRLLPVHASAVDRQARPLLWKTDVSLVQPQLAANVIEQVFRIRTIEQRKGLAEPERLGVQSQQPIGDGVEGATPEVSRERRITCRRSRRGGQNIL